jgi:energy-coupling factor transporter ATP-binding protein EcfA2
MQVALDYVSRRARETDVTITLEKCRQALGALGLTGSLALQTIGSLSGGEKARVALALFALVPANVLLLDEASNHLDIATLEVSLGLDRPGGCTQVEVMSRWQHIVEAVGGMQSGKPWTVLVTGNTAAWHSRHTH